MITKRTVFVLGAGASMPYGFPSGATLREDLCRDATTDSGMVGALCREMEIPEPDVRSFGEAFGRSLQPSIDAFLSRRADFVEIGKLCIAYQLCHRENPLNLFGEADGDHWYRELFHAMTTGLMAPSDLRCNQVRFITFNYDRSLEYALHEATKNTFGVDDSTAYAHWSAINVCHVYGQLGPFHPHTDTGKPFSKDTSPASLRTAANGIRIIPEARADDTPFGMARAWFDWAEQICFLGFGYDELNMDRLGLNSVIEFNSSRGRKLPSVVASTFGLTESEVDRRLKPSIKGIHHRLLCSKNLMTLRDSGVLG